MSAPDPRSYGEDALFQHASVVLGDALAEIEEFDPARVIFVYGEPCKVEKVLVELELDARRPIAGDDRLRARVRWRLALEEVLEADEGEIAGRFEDEVMSGEGVRLTLSLAERAARTSSPGGAALN